MRQTLHNGLGPI